MTMFFLGFLDLLHGFLVRLDLELLVGPPPRPFVLFDQGKLLALLGLVLDDVARLLVLAFLLALDIALG